MGERENHQLEEQVVLTDLEIDAIGEVLNISMGSAATAISTMLDKQVAISTPKVEMRQFHAMDYAALEPAMLVKINYVEGLAGSNVMVFRQRDMEMILNLLMGNDSDPSDDFVFDELSMSAAGEVMNQMMGASATALSDFLGRVINISTPETSIVGSESSYSEAVEVEEGTEIIAVSFQLTIDRIMDSSFASIMSCELAKDIVKQVLGQHEQEISAIQPMREQEGAASFDAQQAAPPQQKPILHTEDTPAGENIPQKSVPEMQHDGPPVPNTASVAQAATPPQQSPPEGNFNQAQAQMPPYGGGYPPYYGYPGYPPMGPYMPYPQQFYGMQPDPAGQQQILKQPTVNVQTPQFPQFSVQNAQSVNAGGNMDLLMGVSLDVSVEIGKAKRKISEIIEFGQGTVIELNKQAGAPVDIVVNGRLLARGDVVVIDDNFGVRITEILGTKELMESLKEEAL